MKSIKEETISSYNKNAKYFSEKFSILTDTLRRQEFQKFIELLKGKKVLDMGCGSGDHALYFSQQGLDVTCIDLSSEMIRLCKEKGLNAEIMDIEQLRFKKGSFDGIWAVTSLLHIKKSNILEVRESLYHTLKPKGILFIIVKEGEGEGFIDDEGFNTRRFFSFWKKEEFFKIFEKRFDLIEFRKEILGNTSFLQFFFSKKP